MVLPLLSLLMLTIISSACQQESEPAKQQGDSAAAQESEEGYLETSLGLAKVYYKKIGEGRILVDGDIIAREGDIKQKPDRPLRLAAAASAGNEEKGRRKWPNKTVPYAFKANVPREAKQKFLDATETWSKATGLKFVARKWEDDFVLVEYLKSMPGAARASYVGRIGGAQEFTVTEGCDTRCYLHEIGHALGLWHEHQRADAPAYVITQLDQMNDNERASWGREYGYLFLTLFDVSSVMLYWTDITASGAITMAEIRNLNIFNIRPIPRNMQLSRGDIEGVKRYYSSDEDYPSFFIFNPYLGKCLEPATDRPVDGTLIRLTTQCDNRKQQQFKFSGENVVHIASGLCLADKKNPLLANVKGKGGFWGSTVMLAQCKPGIVAQDLCSQPVGDILSNVVCSGRQDQAFFMYRGL